MTSQFKKRLAALLSFTLAVAPALANPYEYRKAVPRFTVEPSVTAPPPPTQTANLVVSTASLDFSGKVVGLSSQQTFTVTNAGTQSAAWSNAPALSGNAAFSIASTTCSGTLTAGASCAVTVQFAPTQVASVTGQIGLTAGGVSKTVSLVGSGDGARALDIEGPSPELSVRQGESVSGSFTIANNNSSAMVLGTVAVTGGSAQYFSVNASNCSGKTLQPGTACTATIVLSGGSAGSGPMPAGSVSATVSVPVSGVTQTLTVPGTVVARDYILLSGGSQSNTVWDYGLFCYNRHSGVYGGTVSQYACTGGGGYTYADNRISCTTCVKYQDGVTLSAVSVPFNSMTVGVPKSLQVAVQNNSASSVDLAVTALSMTYGAASDVNLTTSCNTTLASGEPCLLQIDLTPSSATNYLGRITLQSNAEGSPYYVTFTGTSAYLNATVGPFSVAAVDYGAAPFTLTAPTSNSPGAWTYTSSNPAVASVSGNTVTVVAGGSTTITARQAAAGSYGPSTVTATLTVNPINPTVGSWASMTKAVGDTATLTPPSSTSSGTWTYAISDATAATIVGSTITFSKAGTFTLTATQAATGNYKTASATATVTVTQGAPVIGAWSSINVASGSSAFSLTYPTSTSNGAWSATSSDPTVATISNGVVTVVGLGTTTLTATQAATANYAAGSAVTTLTVTIPSGSTKLMWQFNGTAATPATAANLVSDTGHTATNVGGVAYTANGLEGNFGKFSGGSIDIYSADFQLSNKPFTFEWWQRGATTMAQFTFGNPAQYSTMASNGSGLYFSTTGSTWNYMLSPSTITSGVWTHMAVVRTSTSLVLYQNGVEKSRTAIGSNIPLMTSPGNRLAFGAYSGGSTMDIDQVRLTVGVARYNGNFTPSTALTVN